MKINLKKVIGIMVLIIAFEVVYLIGFYMPNKVVYGNSEEEIAEEIPICESELESENENLISESEIAEEDLTEIPNDDIIIIEDESIEEEVVEEEVIEVIEKEPTLEDILIDECPFVVIDEIYEIDSYEEGNWYCYYLFADGDVYVVTLKNNHVDVCVQLN